MNAKLSLFIPKSSITTEVNKTGSWRFLRPIYDEKTAPCGVACPASEDIATIQMLTHQGYFKEAWETILAENPFPGICGRVCFHPCERACNRGMFDEPINIHSVERFLSDTAARYKLLPELNIDPSNGFKIAIIGSGPGGLAASYYFTLLGYECSIFESLPEPGGLLRWGIPEYRLPKYVLDREIDFLRSLGVQFKLKNPIKLSELDELASEYDAVFIGVGTWNSRKGSFKGAEFAEDGLKFLSDVRAGQATTIQGTVVVVGGGNTAIDVARTVLRLGGKAVVVYRRRKEDMPAFDEEIDDALEEGIEFLFQQVPVEISSENGSFEVSLCETKIEGVDDSGRGRFVLGTKITKLKCTRVFLCLGFESNAEWFPSGKPYQWFNSALFLDSDRKIPLIFGGDLTTAEKTVTYAIASAKEGAIAFDIFKKYGRSALEEKLSSCTVGNGRFLSLSVYKGLSRAKRNKQVVHIDDINTDYFSMSSRLAVPRLLPEERTTSFKEIDLHISGSIAIQEAGRCFNCGICNECDNCRLFCPDISIKRDQEKRFVDYEYCKGCGVCVAECPRCAMSLIEESLQ